MRDSEPWRHTLESIAAKNLPEYESEAWYNLLRDLLLDSTKSAGDVGIYLEVSRSTILGKVARSKNNATSNLRKVCTSLQWSIIERNIEERKPYRSSRQNSILPSSTKTLIAGGRGSFVHNKTDPKPSVRPPRDGPRPLEQKVIDWARGVQKTLGKRMPAMPRELDGCCFPIDRKDGKSAFCGMHTIARLFGGYYATPPELKESFANQLRSYCTLHAYTSLTPSGRSHLERTLNSILETLE